MEKQSDQKQQQVALTCPRCDSSNTKFCYYNNYSLSQPRHFCKACKRYWTRGETIRNVPVGGGFRKNKRVKRPTTISSSIDSTSSPSAPSPNSNPSSQQPQIHIGSNSTSNHINPLFDGLPSNSSDLNLQFSRFNSSRISGSVYDLHPHLNALGLGHISSEEDSDNGYYTNWFTSNNTLPYGYSNNSMIFSPTSTSTMLQQKIMNGTDGSVTKGAGPGTNTTFKGLAAPPIGHIQMQSRVGNETYMVALKDVKVEGLKNRLDERNGVCQNQMEHVELSDPTLYWNTATDMAEAWNDQPNDIGPSITSLI
ncbi:hypothetical protein TanjilG_20301 [Lupinus angustifolius]|uniref:Dof zinc finger protein n=1 Tax=Lupinus angustifolius TaxID=3871 RepID=A0A1J7GHJ5_LUPAN|nr:PREDICTED: dof zinc finger protein DOF3.1-like [Lupinus angustifolius]OIV89528.1 hypothetical protein TanjilG_20301 [Lupinus angustifolius]